MIKEESIDLTFAPPGPHDEAKKNKKKGEGGETPGYSRRWWERKSPVSSITLARPGEEKEGKRKRELPPDP